MLSKKNTASKEFGIIGLGRFGVALAKALSAANKEILVIDKDEEKVKRIRNIIPEAVVQEVLNAETLNEAGITNCDTVIVCIGEIDVNIMTTMDLINLGVPRVIAKANSKEHGMVIEKIGGDAIYPERDTAMRLAGILLQTKALDLMELNDNYVISEIKIPREFDAYTLGEFKLEKYNLNVIAVEKDTKLTQDFDEKIILDYNDAIVVIGKFADVERFEQTKLLC
ncbi:MAG: potassium channel family protein [Anaerovoracaceae bacterium]